MDANKNPDEQTVARAHALADELGEEVATIPVPLGALRAVLGEFLLRPLSDVDTPGLEKEWMRAPYVAIPGENDLDV